LSYDQSRDVPFMIVCLLAREPGPLGDRDTDSGTRKPPDDGMQPIYGVVTLIVLSHAIAAGVTAAVICGTPAGLMNTSRETPQGTCFHTLRQRLIMGLMFGWG
jgi:hypothetical protein